MDELKDKFKKSAEDFSLIPSSGIWKNIERDIHQRERKRRIIIFFFLITGIVGSGILLFNYQLTNTSTQTSPQVNREPSTKQNSDHQNIRIKEGDLVNRNTFPGSFSEMRRQKNYETTNSRQKHDLNTDSISLNGMELPSVERNTSRQNGIAVNNSPQPYSNKTISTTIPIVLNDSIETSLSGITEEKSLQIENNYDSIFVLKLDTIRKDSLITKKDTINSVSHQSNWSISLGVAPTVSYVEFNEKGDYRIIANYRDSLDKNLLTWNYHFAINYMVTPKLELFIGAGLIKYVEQILNKEAVYHYDTTVLTGPQPTPIITVSRSFYNINSDSTGVIKNKFSWLKVPIGISYNFFPTRKLTIALKPEIAFNKLFHCEGYTYNFLNRTYEKINASDVRSWLFAYGVGLSFQYKVNRNLFVELTPFYSNFPKSIYIAAYPVSQRFQQFEFQMSLRYHFK